MPAGRLLLRRILGVCAAAIIMAVIGIFSLRVQEPLLVPSLGSAVLVQTLTPERRSGRIWPTGMGQLAGLAGGLVGVFLAQAAPAPIFMGGHPLVASRLLAACVAVLVTGGLQCGLRAVSPAGGATALIVAFGMETPTLPGIARLTVGILLITGLGEAARHTLLQLK